MCTAFCGCRIGKMSASIGAPELSADNCCAALHLGGWTSALTVHQRSKGWERVSNLPDKSASQGAGTVSSVTFFRQAQSASRGLPQGRVGRLVENKPRDHLSASIQNSPTRTDVSSKSRVRNCLTLERVAPSPLLTNDTGRCCFQRVTEIAGTAYLRHLVEVAPRKAPPPTIVMVSDSKPFWDASQNSASRDDVDICAAARAVACLKLWGLRIRSLDAICCRRLLISRDEPAGESRTATQMSRRTALSATHRLRQGRPNAAERSCRPPGRTDQKLSGNILDPDRHARLAWKRRSPPRDQPSRGGPEWSLNPPLS